MRGMDPRYSQRTRKAGNSRFPQNQQTNSIVQIILAFWMVGASIAVFIAYLATKDNNVILIWTTSVVLATIVFTYFFYGKESTK